MKVRMRHNHQVEREVWRETNHPGDPCWAAFVSRGLVDGEYTFLSREDWEKVPEPTWRDVTEACAYTDARYLEHDGQRVLGRLADEQYRLSKVQVYKRIAVGSGQTLDVAYTPVSAFLIEKKVSE